MANLPSARVTQATSGGGVGKGSNILAVMSCTQNGQLTCRQYGRVQEILDDHGYCEGVEACAHNTQLNGLPNLFVGLATATPGVLGPVDLNGVTGTSDVSFSGTPYDDERLVVEIVDGGTVGTAGISFRVSRDGGTSFGGTIRLGTATSYAIPGTGITVSFGTGTLVADDVAYAACRAPQWDAAGLVAGFDLLKAQSIRPRLILLCGDVDDTTDVQDVIDEVMALETEDQQFTRIMFAARPRYPNVSMQKTRGFFKRDGVAPTDIDFAATGDTITRNTGSWIDDGFAVGQSVTVAGSASNNGVKGVISALTATVMTLPASPGLTDESNVNGALLTITGVGPGDVDFAATTITRSTGNFVTDGFKVGMMVTVSGSGSNNGTLGPLTAVSASVLTFAGGGVVEANVSGALLTIAGSEPRSAARAAFNLIVGSTPQTAKVSHRAAIRYARARRKSPINSTRKMRPASWACAFRAMGHQENTSSARKDLGPLEGWTMHDNNGVLEHEAHDELTESGILAMRGGCLTTDRELPGIYDALPITLDEDDAPLSRLPVGFVCDIAARTALTETNLLLGADVVTKPDGTIKESDALKIEKAITNRLRAKLLVPGPEGVRASDVTFTMSRDVNILEPGTEIPCEVDVLPKGTIEKVTTVIRVSRGGV